MGDDVIVVAVQKIQRLEHVPASTTAAIGPRDSPRQSPEDVLIRYVSELHWERQRAMEKFQEERLRHMAMLHEEWIAVLHALRERWSCEDTSRLQPRSEPPDRKR